MYRFTFCRSSISLLVGMIRNLGYNNRKVAVAGSMPIGVKLLKNFKEEPWLDLLLRVYTMIYKVTKIMK